MRIETGHEVVCTFSTTCVSCFLEIPASEEHITDRIFTEGNHYHLFCYIVKDIQ